MYKIAVVGDWDSIYGFASIGLDIYPVDSVPAAGKSIKALAENGYAVIYVTEALCPHIKKETDIYRGRVLPAIIPIPGMSGNNGHGMAQVRKSVEQAVGSDILFGGQGTL